MTSAATGWWWISTVTITLRTSSPNPNSRSATWSPAWPGGSLHRRTLPNLRPSCHVLIVFIRLPSSDGYKQIMPYDLYHPLPRYVPNQTLIELSLSLSSLASFIFNLRWESSPWTACSTSCGGGIQSRSVSCVEEDMQGVITPTDEWKCLYSPKTPILQPCNAFDCPVWLAQEWSPVGARFLISKEQEQCVGPLCSNC